VRDRWTGGRVIAVIGGEAEQIVLAQPRLEGRNRRVQLAQRAAKPAASLRWP
jgi:hypothetical protein